MKVFIAASAVILAASASVATADTNWTGAYVGAYYGTASGTDYEGYQFDPETYELTGSMYGGFAGYRMETGSIVWGGEIATTLGTDLYEVEYPDYYYGTIFDVKAQAGYDMGSVLIFIEAGFSTTEFFADSDTSDALSGWNAGIGVDTMVTDNFFVGAEFLYRDLRNADFFGVDNGAQAQISTWQVRAGYRF